MISITVENPIWSRITEGAKLLKPLLSFRSHFYRQGQYSKTRQAYDKSLIMKDGLIYTGWLPRIKEYCKDQKINLIVELSDEHCAINDHVPSPKAIPSLPGIKYQSQQVMLIQAALNHRRGAIVSPMGTGKTIIAAAIIKAFSKHNVLFLCHNLSILTKTAKDFEALGFKNITMLGDGDKYIGDKKLVISTMQTFRNLDLENIGMDFQVVIVDESHCSSKFDASYMKILSHVIAPIRIGLTATPPENQERKLVSEGLLGPIIGRVTFEDAKELDIMVQPKIELISIPIDKELKQLRHYNEIYLKCIIENKVRNRAIIAKAKELTIGRGLQILIFSSEKSIKHGEILLEMALAAGIDAVYIQGSTESAERELYIKEMEAGRLQCAIVTRVWREGVNIKHVGGIILAKGGKGEEGTGSDEALIQTIGRALRKHDGKNEAIIVDVLDPYRYLAEHCVERLSIYSRLGWL